MTRDSRDFYSRFKIDPDSIGYVEAHGTGTKLGDPIELEALTAVFGEKTSRKRFCALGSVKSNIGHTSGAAGVASVQKVLLSIKHRTLVPTLHVDRENVLFDLGNSPFYISRETRSWEAKTGTTRRAGISAFGFSGTNAHMVIEEYVPALTPSYQDSDVCILLSARTPDQLKQRVFDLLEFMRQESGKPIAAQLASIAYTLQVGRDSMRERLGFVAGSSTQLVDILERFVSGSGEVEGVFRARATHGHDTLNGQSPVDRLLKSANLSELISLWVKGHDIDWARLYGESPPRRICLPTYPFAKERYWIDTPSATSTSFQVPDKKDTMVSDLPNREPRQRTYYRPHWQESALSVQEFTMSGPVLVLDTDGDLFLSVKECLEDKVGARTVLWVRFGEAYQELEPGIFTIDPGKEEHTERLIQRLKAQGQLPQHLVHHCVDSERTVSAQLEGNFYSLLFLTKALMSQKQPSPVNLVSLYSGQGEDSSPIRAALGGFFKTLASENTAYHARLVEIQAEASVSEVSYAEKARLVLSELQQIEAGSIEVRYRPSNQGGDFVRFQKCFVRCAESEVGVGEIPLKQNGVYLITGGLGGLGFIFSLYLASEYNARLVLTGRSPAGPEQDEKLRQLKAHQTEVIYIQADVANLEDMKSVIEQAETCFGRLNGVIHSAGVNRDALIVNKTKADLEQVISPKLWGTHNLDKVTAAIDLDLFVLFSSGAGAFGNPGQCDYAFANHFMDAFASCRELERRDGRRSGRSLSINWPFWEEGGMDVAQEVLVQTEKVAGMCGLPTADGIRYLEDFLRSNLSQGLALYGYPSRIDEYLNGRATHSRVSSLSPVKVKSGEILALTMEYLTELVSAETKLPEDRIDVQERFESFGFDSVMIGRFNARLEADLGELPKTLLYEHETIEELAIYLCKEVESALIQRFELSSKALGSQAEQVQMPGEYRQLSEHAQGESTYPAKIAIIGVHGRFPHSSDLHEFWENLKQGKDLVDTVPASRWDCEAFYSPDPDEIENGKIYGKWGGFVDDFDRFDASFFNLSSQEARIMDPQERLFMQSAWHVIEDAGYTRASLKALHPKARSADVGVFVGVTSNTYHLLGPEECHRGNPIAPASLPWSIANRVSYFLDFQGPSLPVDTACSSSLVAIHLACESLRRRECQVALAGGVNLYLHPAKYQSLCQNRMLSLDGKCRSFGAGGDGFVPGEGVGSVLLKPLDKAIKDRDHVYAVIPASAFDHAGRSSGYAAPNPNSQASLINGVLVQSGIHPEWIGYVEGHGTGTELGDSLEIAALTQAFERETSKKKFCPVGSIKANIGHSESAAGIAGVAKVLMQLKHEQLAPSIHSAELNPNIDFDNSPFYPQHELSSWESQPDQPRRALVNSFGAGGVNACLVLEEFATEDRQQSTQSSEPLLFVLSAKSVEQLGTSARRLADFLAREASVSLANVAYTLQVGREPMNERVAVVASEANELIARLREWDPEKTTFGIYRGTLEQAGSSKKSGQTEQMHTSLERRDLDALAKLWVAGEQLDWDKLYTDQPGRVSLPGYPFLRNRYWVSDAPVKNASQDPVYNRLHPLISQNTSTLSSTCFSSLLSAQAFYATDHDINGQKIFPGTGFLEMALVAGSVASEQKVERIKDIVWVHPLGFRGDSQLARTCLVATDNDIEFEISSLDGEHDRIVHSEGRLVLRAWSDHEELPSDARLIEDLVNQGGARMDGPEFYSRFAQAGFNYGPAFQVIESVTLDQTSALSKLRLPGCLASEFEQFVLHPSIVDGALQTVVALVDSLESGTPFLPFALDELVLLRPLTSVCYAYAQATGSKGGSQAGIRSFDIQILSESGYTLIELNGFCVRPLDQVERSRHVDPGYRLVRT